MIIELILTLALLVGTIVGVYTDMKKRYVPNFVSYSLIIIGVFGNLIISILNSSIYPFVYSIGLVGILYVASYILYRIGYWGGGDAKLLVAYGAVLPVYPELLKTIFNPSIAPWPFIVTLWFNISILGVGFAALFAVYLAIKNKNKFAPEVRKILQKYKIVVYIIFIWLMSVFVSFFFSQEFGYFLAGLWAVTTLLFYLMVLLKSVENSCMYKFVKPSKLDEGDWIVGEITIGDFKYTPRKTGIFQREINELIKFEKSGKLEKVKVKEGTPFVPSFFFGLIYSLIFGDSLFAIINAII